MKILAVESSAVSAGAALSEDGKLLGEFYLNVGLTHSCTLMPMIESLLRYADVSVRDVDLFAVSNGPGSFTGVRIGVATVKGLAQPLGKPCVGISTLLAMAYNLRATDALICCAMDARCRQVYTALFESKNGRIVRLTEDDALSLDALCDRLRAYDRKIIFIGDGASLCCEAFRGVLPDAELAPQTLRYQRASSVAEAAWVQGAERIGVSADELTVSYLRLSQAERERKQKMEAQKT